MFQSFDEKVANVSLAFELMMDGGLPQPKVTDIDGDKKNGNVDEKSKSDNEKVKVTLEKLKKIKLMKDGEH